MKSFSEDITEREEKRRPTFPTFMLLKDGLRKGDEVQNHKDQHITLQGYVQLLSLPIPSSIYLFI